MINSLYYHFKISRAICHLSPLNLIVPIKLILGRVTKNGFEVSIHFLVVVYFRKKSGFLLEIFKIIKKQVFN